MDNGFKRQIGKSGIEVSAMGLGCWAIGGQFWLDGKADGWGEVNDEESINAIQKAYELGVTFFDSADVYGAGHSEEVLGKALKGIRDKVTIATKFGYKFNEKTKVADGVESSPEYIKEACRESLRRLNTDYIDLYQLHIWSLPEKEAVVVFETLEELKKEGLIRSYGWSTDNLDCARLFAHTPGFTSIQHDFNVFLNADELLTICEENDLASINRSPLAMGFLSGKFNAGSKLSNDDVRGAGHEWVRYFENGKPQKEFLDKLDAVREILRTEGRSLVQGALAYIWGKSKRTIPIPGFKNVKQAEENAGAMQFGPLSIEKVHEIEQILKN